MRNVAEGPTKSIPVTLLISEVIYFNQRQVNKSSRGQCYVVTYGIPIIGVHESHVNELQEL